MAFFYDRIQMDMTTEPQLGDILLFTTNSPGIPGSHLIEYGRMKGWVDLEATLWLRWLASAASSMFVYL